MRVLVLDGVNKDGLTPLAQEPGIEVDEWTAAGEDELCAVIGRYHAVIVRSATQITSRILEAGKNLKVVGRAGAGVDNIDIDAATRLGVLVINAPDGNTTSAAEHTLAMMLALARMIPQACMSLKNGRWERKSFLGVELKGKTLGIIGLGRVGSAVAKSALAMGMQVIAHDPFVGQDKAGPLGVTLLALDDLLRQSDFITIHLPLTGESRGIIGEQAFSLMKEGARLINCARGGVVEEKALYHALQEGKVAGAALDVFEKEPAMESPLLKLANVIATPHLGASTREAQLGVALDVSRGVAAALKGKFVPNAVNASYAGRVKNTR